MLVTNLVSSDLGDAFVFGVVFCGVGCGILAVELVPSSVFGDFGSAFVVGVVLCDTSPVDLHSLSIYSALLVGRICVPSSFKGALGTGVIRSTIFFFD